VREYISTYTILKTRYRDVDNYFDETHLMQDAAIEFTDELISYLKDLIENKLNINN